MDNKPLRPNHKHNSKNRRNIKNAGFVTLILLIGLVVFAAIGQPSTAKTIDFTQAVAAANKGQYSKIVVKGNELSITKKGESQASLKAYTDPNANLKEIGFDYSKVNIQYKPGALLFSLLHCDAPAPWKRVEFAGYRACRPALQRLVPRRSGPCPDP